MKAFFTRGADELLDDKMWKLTESKEFTQGLSRYQIISSTFEELVTQFVEQQADKAVASETIFKQDMSPDVPVKEKTAAPSPLTGGSPESKKASKYDMKDKKKEESSS